MADLARHDVSRAHSQRPLLQRSVMDEPQRRSKGRSISLTRTRLTMRLVLA